MTTEQMTVELLDLKGVERMFKLGRSYIYSAKDFPRPIKIGSNSRWLLSDLIAYIEQKKADRK